MKRIIAALAAVFCLSASAPAQLAGWHAVLQLPPRTVVSILPMQSSSLRFQRWQRCIVQRVTSDLL